VGGGGKCLSLKWEKGPLDPATLECSEKGRERTEESLTARAMLKWGEWRTSPRICLKKGGGNELRVTPGHLHTVSVC